MGFRPWGCAAIIVAATLPACQSQSDAPTSPPRASVEAAAASPQTDLGPGSVTVVDEAPDCEITNESYPNSVPFPGITDAEGFTEAVRRGPLSTGHGPNYRWVIHFSEDGADRYRVDVSTGEARDFIRFGWSRKAAGFGYTADCEISPPACVRTDNTRIAPENRRSALKPRSAARIAGASPIVHADPSRVLILRRERLRGSGRQLRMFAQSGAGRTVGYAIGRPTSFDRRKARWAITEFGSCAPTDARPPRSITSVPTPPGCNEVRTFFARSLPIGDFTTSAEFVEALRAGDYPMRFDATDHLLVHQTSARMVDVYEIALAGQSRTVTRYRIARSGGAALSQFSDCELTQPACERVEDMEAGLDDRAFYDSGTPRLALRSLPVSASMRATPRDRWVVFTSRFGRRGLQAYALDDEGVAVAYALGSADRDTGRWSTSEHGSCR